MTEGVVIPNAVRDLDFERIFHYKTPGTLHNPIHLFTLHFCLSLRSLRPLV
jgi:hypothetical protein